MNAIEGFVEPVVRDEFPGLSLSWVTVAARRRSSPRELVDRLHELAGRYRGSSVIALRTKPVPQAYRSFFRQIGLDPDVERIPSEQAAVARLMQGGFRSSDLISDACLVALIETGVPVWALDAAAVAQDGLGIRTTTVADGQRALDGGQWIEPGSLAVAGREVVHGLLFREPASAHRVSSRTKRVALFAVCVDGVPAIHVEEALEICTDLLG